MAKTSFLTRRALLATAGSGVFLTACGDIMNRTAGSQVDEGGFGNATFNNLQVQTGQAQAKTTLGRRFADAVPTMVNFAFGSAEIDAAGAAVIRQQADFMRQFPELRFSVFGHTDAVGGEASNLRLGRRRAAAVVAALGRQGVSRSRLDALVSLGESQLLVATEDRERANRRTVTEVAGFVENDPLVLDGKYALIVYRQYIASAAPPAQ